MNRRIVAMMAVLATLFALGAVAVLGPGGDTTSTSTKSVRVDPHGIELPGVRHVHVTQVMPEPSTGDEDIHVMYESGSMPPADTTGTVLTDQDCTPDAMGVSHCLNRIRLANGETMAVRHPHRMSEVPCLAPGEVVEIDI
jgi:hypothetical protein